jgi:hypothetical protein
LKTAIQICDLWIGSIVVERNDRIEENVKQIRLEPLVADDSNFSRIIARANHSFSSNCSTAKI